METVVGIGLVAALLICPLMMVGMIAGGWISAAGRWVTVVTA